MIRAWRILSTAAVGISLSASLFEPAIARDWPIPPCEQEAYPPPPAIDSPPNVEVWFGDEAAPHVSAQFPTLSE